MPLMVGLIYVSMLTVVLMYAAGGLGIGIFALLVLLYALAREASKAHLIDTDAEMQGHGEIPVKA